MSSKSQIKDYPFTNFTIKVDVESSWQKTVKKVLKSVKGVTSFRMEDDGRINISGYIKPNLLLECLRKAGKDVRIVHWQYGECSSNLYEKKDYGYNNDYGNYGYNNVYGYYGYNNGYGYNNYGYNNNAYNGNGKSNYLSKPTSSDNGSTCSLM